MDAAEQALVDYQDALRSDFWGCARAEYKILAEDKDAGTTSLIAPIPREEQAMLQAEVERQFAERGYARIISVKPRQIGESTWAQLLVVNMCQTVPFTRALTISYDKDGTKFLNAMAELVVDNLETPEAFPTAVHTDGLIRWANGSSARYQTQGGPRGTAKGRGGTPTVLVVEELPSWEEGRRNTSAADVAQALMTSVPLRPGTIVLVIATAKGIGNLFHRMCMRAYTDEPGNFYRLMFFPFQKHAAYRLHIDDAAERADVFARSAAMHTMHAAGDTNGAWNEARKLGYTRLEFERACEFGLDPEQVAWWRQRKVNDFDDDQNRFDQEYPMSLEIAFVSSGAGYIPGPKIQQLLEKSKVTPHRKGTLRRVEGKVVFEEDGGPLWVWEEPQAGCVYLVSADVASGLTGKDHDNTAIPAFNRHTRKFAAAYYGQCYPEETARHIDLIAEWYHDALCIVERKAEGLAVLAHMKDRYPDRSIYHQTAPAEVAQAHWSNIAGFDTNVRTRALLYALLSEAIRKDLVEALDPRLLRELLTIIKDQTGKVGAPKGFHDDWAVAAGICLVVDKEFADAGEPTVTKSSSTTVARVPAPAGIVDTGAFDGEPGEQDPEEVYSWA